MKTILIVEDDPRDRSRVERLVRGLCPEARRLVFDSFEGVINEVINENQKVDCAVVDMQIFQHQNALEEPKPQWGIEVLVRLIGTGVPAEKILVLTSFEQRIAPLLAKEDQKYHVKVRSKVLRDEVLKREIAELLNATQVV